MVTVVGRAVAIPNATFTDATLVGDDRLLRPASTTVTITFNYVDPDVYEILTGGWSIPICFRQPDPKGTE